MVQKTKIVESIRAELADMRRKFARLETMLHQLEREADDDPAPPELTDAPPSILIVDDDEQIRLILQRLLESASYLPLEAERGRDAIEILEEGDVDLMLLDINLQVGSGIEVMRILRRRQIEVPTIVISAFVSTGITEQLMELGVDKIMAKPFRTDRVLEEIECALHRDLSTE
ncbi:MAG: hypothetical protein CME26_05030 [Gemmatimonadetes bacterium]|nr:hypothetical protein [Gemmatimonadota bacterium]